MAGQAVVVPLGIEPQPLHAELVVADLQIVLPAGVERVDHGQGDQPVAVAADLAAATSSLPDCALR